MPSTRRIIFQNETLRRAPMGERCMIGELGHESTTKHPRERSRRIRLPRFLPSIISVRWGLLLMLSPNRTKRRNERQARSTFRDGV